MGTSVLRICKRRYCLICLDMEVVFTGLSCESCDYSGFVDSHATVISTAVTDFNCKSLQTKNVSLSVSDVAILGVALLRICFEGISMELCW